MFLFQNVPVDVRSIEIVQLDALATVLRGSPVARLYTLPAGTYTTGVSDVSEGT